MKKKYEFSGNVVNETTVLEHEISFYKSKIKEIEKCLKSYSDPKKLDFLVQL